MFHEIFLLNILKKLANRMFRVVTLQPYILGLTGFDSMKKRYVSVQSSDGRAL